MAPLLMALMFISFPGHSLAALIVFIAASLTDMADGMLARRNNQITDFGKLLDPIADKMLITAAFLGFVFTHTGWGVLWVAFISLTREFLVMSIRMLAARDGNVIAASVWGKLKTVTQMTAVIFALSAEFFLQFASFQRFEWLLGVLTTVLLWFAAAATLVSGVDYAIKNAKYIDHRK
jgi:CDP-diacylglycerol--glycerol-3-phosphate 3-phosphatidyltransferase